MTTVEYVFGSSFDETTCEKYIKSSKKKSRGTCKSCGLPKAQHLLGIGGDPDDKEEDEEEIDPIILLCQVFVDLRNLRLCVINFFGLSGKEVNAMLPQLISLLTDSLFAIEEVSDADVMDMDQLIEAGQELVGYFEPSAEDDNMIEFISAMDDVYYRLYYSVSLTWRSKSQSDDDSSCPIPMPHQYFTTYLTDESTINKHLETVFSNNFSPAYKSQISRVFGLSESMKLNPLLSLHFSRWRESICLLHTLPGIAYSTSTLPRLLEACVLPPLDEEAAEASQHATMKPLGDPLLPPLLRVWNDSCRTWSCHLYAYATPNPEALDCLAAHAPLVEIGAGTGYWAHMLRQRHPNLEIFAYDAAPPSHIESSRENTYHGRAQAWTAVAKGGVDRLTRHRTATLFLCYPPPDSDMALDAVRAYTGDTVCYVGEYRGDTGTSKFEALLDASFQCVEHVPLPNFGDTCYDLTVWRRVVLKAGADVVTSLNHPCRCTTCGVLKSRMYRCRLTYAVTFCSNACAAAGRERHLDELTFKYLLHKSKTNTNTNTNTNAKKKRKLSETSESSSSSSFSSSSDVAATGRSSELVGGEEGTGTGPLFDVKSSFFSTLKIKCPWL